MTAMPDALPSAMALVDAPVTELRLTDEGRQALAGGEIGCQRLFVMDGDHIPFTINDLAAVLPFLDAEQAARNSRRDSASAARRWLRRARTHWRAVIADATYLVSCAVDDWALGR